MSRLAAFHPQDRLEQLARPEVLRQWLTGVDSGLRREAGNRDLLRMRIQLLRGLGDIGAAQRACLALGEDPASDRMRAILSGDPVFWADRAGPVPFIRIDDFLTEAQQQALWAVAAAPTTRFISAGVQSEHGNRVDPTFRQAEVMRGSDPVREWFLPLVEDVVAEATVLPRLGLLPFEIGRRELQVTRHDDGGFLQTHRDDGPGGLWRRVSYVYYFHRQPRRFTGGDLLLFDEDESGRRSGAAAFTRIVPAHNSLLLFPANRLHAVTRLASEGDDPLDGRWTVNGWLNQAPDGD